MTEEQNEQKEKLMNREEKEKHEEEMKKLREVLNVRQVVNADNELLGPGPWGFGHVEEVNGSTATEVPEFVPTRHELLELVRYYHHEILDIHWLWSMYGQSGSPDIRQEPFAYRRISRIAKILGDEPVDKVIQEVESKFREGLDPETWTIFTEGSAEERSAYTEKIYSEMDRKDNLFERAIERFNEQESFGPASTALRHIGYHFDREVFAKAVHEMLDHWKARGQTLRSIHLSDEGFMHLSDEGKEAGLEMQLAKEYAHRVENGEDRAEVLEDLKKKNG